MLLRSITLKNLLSFKDATLELRPLNVLIGANGSGKSNLIDAISLLQGAPRNLASAMQRGDGVQGWLRKAEPPPEFAGIECEMDVGGEPVSRLRYTLHFTESNYALLIVRESLSRESGSGPPVVFDRTRNKYLVGGAVDSGDLHDDHLPIEPTASVLGYGGIPDPEFAPARSLARRFTAIRVYREFSTITQSRIRRGSTPDAINDFLVEDGSNLALMLSRLNLETGLGEINRRLHRFFELAQEVLISVHGGVAQTYVREQGVPAPFPANRLSAGTLRFLCLLTVLLHPKPPDLICIEEPEIGLHPDAIQILGEVLVEASERTQLIVTTHSEALVDALSPAPESVVICDRDFDGSTQFQRLSREKLDAWLEHYTLGDLWKKGEIGGNRW
jgi:predicted ATPase